MWQQYVVGIDMPIQEYGEVPTAQSGVYFLFAHDGEMLYIGKAISIHYRLSQHARAGREFTHFGCLEVPAGLVAGIEAAYIEAIRPGENMKLEPTRWEHHGAMVEAIKDRWAAVERRPARVIVIEPRSFPPGHPLKQSVP
jgi:hypothetical protein